ncbi:MAG TPA: hypothetical protein VF595_00755, partial [Tepidisphaeraceae bacterium]
IVLLTAAVLSTQSFAGGTVVIVVGAEGQPEYGREFTKWADRWAAAAISGSMNVVTVGRDDSAQPASAPSSTAPSTAPTTAPAIDKTSLESVLRREGSASADPLWVVLIGHGTWDGREAKFNLRGQDVSDKELADWLRPIRRPLALINCASASGPFLNRSAGPGRVVITATRTASETQFARFGDALSASIADAGADLDKDGQTSLLEAFIAAANKTDAFYKDAGRLVTEHALLDDNGDGLGVAADWFQGVRATRAAKSGAAVDGPNAHRWHLVPSRTEQTIRPELRARRDELERSVESLRAKKASIPEADYYAQLERLLIDLARIYQENDLATK